MEENRHLPPEPGRVGGAQGRSPSIHVHGGGGCGLRQGRGPKMSLGGEGGGQQINCHSHTQQKPLFSHTGSPEPSPGAVSWPHSTQPPPGPGAEAGTVLGSPLNQKDGARSQVPLRCPSPSKIWGLLSGHGTPSPAGFVGRARVEGAVRWPRAQAGEGVVAKMALWRLWGQRGQPG